MTSSLHVPLWCFQKQVHLREMQHALDKTEIEKAKIFKGLETFQVHQNELQTVEIEHITGLQSALETKELEKGKLMEQLETLR